MGLRFLRIAVVYLFIGALLGGFMGFSQQFTLAPVHEKWSRNLGLVFTK